MFKSLFISLGKKYAISAINELLQKNKNDVDKISNTLILWIKRLKKIIDQLERITERVQDGEIDEIEVKDSLEEIKCLIKEF